MADAASLGDGERAQRLLREGLESGERPEALLPALVVHFRRLVAASSAIEAGHSPSEAALGVGVKPFHQAAFLRSLPGVRGGRGRRALAVLLEADRRLKGGGGLGAHALERALSRLAPPLRPAGTAVA